MAPAVGAGKLHCLNAPSSSCLAASILSTRISPQRYLDSSRMEISVPANYSLDVVISVAHFALAHKFMRDGARCASPFFFFRSLSAGMRAASVHLGKCGDTLPARSCVEIRDSESRPLDSAVVVNALIKSRQIVQSHYPGRTGRKRIEKAIIFKN